RSEPQVLTLAPDETRVLRGTFPDGMDALTLVVSADAFALDDRLPVIRPQPKRLRVRVDPEAAPPALERLIGSSPAIEWAAKPPDADLWVTTPAHVGREPDARGTVVVVPGEPAPRYLAGAVVAERDPLVDGLTWQGLVCRDPPPAPARPMDRVLLWQGRRALVFVRATGGAPQLWVNFDLARSNALRLPAFAVLVSRFVEAVRAAELVPEARNVEIGEPLALAVAPAGGGLGLAGAGARTSPPSRGGRALEAPTRPGLFDVRQGGRLVLHGAAHFADVREADLRAATFVDQVAGTAALAATQNSREDPLGPLWVLALVGLV